jgi:hypothetical protein
MKQRERVSRRMFTARDDSVSRSCPTFCTPPIINRRGERRDPGFAGMLELRNLTSRLVGPAFPVAMTNACRHASFKRALMIVR